MVCRQIMIPRNDTVFMDVNQPLSECIELARRTKHSRYPICDTSMDKVIGVVHIKDLIGMSPEETVDLRTIMRPPHYVPETIPASRLLRQFQATHQHMAFVIDEYGTVIGTVTLENVIEQIVGSVEDEFDIEEPEIVPDGPNQYIVLGSTPIEHIGKELNIHIESEDVDTFSGALTEKIGRILKPGDELILPGAVAEVIDVKGSRAIRIRVTLATAT
jgi:CBS domain containing-hemolysin-like protein